jgi:hypothetical protein
MPQLKIRLEYEPGKFIDRAVGINLEKLPIANGTATAELQEDWIYYVTCHYVLNEKASMTLHLSAPAGFRVKWRDYPAPPDPDAPLTVTWESAVPNRDYFQFRRIYLERK